MNETIANSLTFAVVGVGGIGSTFAYYLASAGHQVTLVARPGSVRLGQLQRDGGIVLKTGERAAMEVVDALDRRTPFDLVIVTTLAHQVEAILPELLGSQASWLHFMMNNFAPQKLASVVGEDRCSFGMPFVTGMVDREGKLDAAIPKGRKTLHGDERWAALFTQAGIASTFEPQMQLWLRCHTPMCIGMESIAYQAKQRERGATWAEASRVARGTHAGFRVVQSLGDPLYPREKRIMNALPNPVLAGVLWGLSRNKAFRDLLATGVNEARALVDGLAAAAKGAGVADGDVKAVIGMKP